MQDVHLGGRPVCLIGIESQAVPRRGFPPTDGPDTYTAGTLFPKSSKKTARAINAASGNRPLVVLANLSGFDGSPESMRELQLEYGAEIGRAIVNFDGPIVFCVISRYHGGAFVVFSKALNPNMTVLALEGSFASVLGGAPAAAVVFAAEVSNRTATDPRVTALQAQLAETSGAERAALNRRTRRGPGLGPGGEARRGRRGVRPRSTPSSARSRSARSTRSSASPGCARPSSRRSSAASPADRHPQPIGRPASIEEVAGLLHDHGAPDPGLEPPQVGARGDALAFGVGDVQVPRVENGEKGGEMAFGLAFSFPSRLPSRLPRPKCSLAKGL